MSVFMKGKAIMKQGLLGLILLLPALVWADGLTTEQGWIRWVPPVSPNSAGYLMLHNESDQDRVLVGASSAVAEAVELHTVIQQQGASTMQRLKQLAVPKQDCVMFEPGGNHIMFIGLKQPLVLGQVVKVSLQFANGDTLDVDLMVKEGQSGGHEHHHEHHGH